MLVDIIANSTVIVNAGINLAGVFGTNSDISISKVVSPNGNINSNFVCVNGGWSLGKSPFLVTPFVNINFNPKTIFNIEDLKRGSTSENIGIILQYNRGTYSSFDPSVTLGWAPSYGYGQSFGYCWEIGE